MIEGWVDRHKEFFIKFSIALVQFIDQLCLFIFFLSFYVNKSRIYFWIFSSSHITILWWKYDENNITKLFVVRFTQKTKPNKYLDWSKNVLNGKESKNMSLQMYLMAMVVASWLEVENIKHIIMSINLSIDTSILIFIFSLLTAVDIFPIVYQMCTKVDTQQSLWWWFRFGFLLVFVLHITLN